jgi:hypothetical protein
VKIHFKILTLLFCFLSFNEIKAQKNQSSLHRDSVIYKKSWEAGFRLSSNGFSLGAEITRAKRFKRSLLFQTRFTYFWDPKQVKQNSQYGSGGFFGGDGFKPFVYGKQNSLFTLYVGAGQKFLLAEKGKRHGVQIFFKYAGGFTLAILKPYSLRVVPKPITGEFYESDLVDVTYVEGVDNSFLDFERIVGASGFGKGWKLKALPGLHLELAMEFDWAKNEGLIKALEIGVASDFYYKKVPVMVEKNRFLYPSVFVGFMIGRRKER